MHKSASGLYRGRSLSPETSKREAAQRRNTISNTQETVGQPTMKRHRAPRRLKSHDAPVGEIRPSKPVRRAKSDGGPGADSARSRSNSRSQWKPSNRRTVAARTKSRSRSRSTFRGPQSDDDGDGDHQAKLQKQLSQSFNLDVVPNCSKRTKGRGGYPSETSPGGTSKVSVSMSVNTMDQSLQSSQSMPYNTTKRGSALSQSLLRVVAPPKRSKSADIKAKNGRKVKRASSKDSIGVPKGVRKTKNVAAPPRANPRNLAILSSEPDIKGFSEMVETATAFGASSLISGHIAKDSTGRNNLPLVPVPSKERKLGDALLSPFSEPEESTICSGGSSVQPSVASNSSKTSKGSFSKKGPAAKLNSATPNAAIGSYFDRENSSQDVFANGSARSSRESVSMASSIGGSLLSDYSKSSGESNRPRENRRVDRNDPFGSDGSASEMSGPGKTISPFSTRAGLESSHTKTTMLATDHSSGATPLIPDSDDEEGESSFHGEMQTPKPFKMESPPPTPLAAPKNVAPKKKKANKNSAAAADSTSNNAKKLPAGAAGTVKIANKGVSIKPPLTKRAKTVPKKPVFDEFEDPIARKKKPKAPLWQRLICFWKADAS